MSNEIPGLIGNGMGGLVPETAEIIRVRARNMQQAADEYRKGLLRRDVTCVHRRWEPKLTGVLGQDGKPITVEDRRRAMEDAGYRPLYVWNAEKAAYEASGENYGHGEKFKIQAEPIGESTQRCMEEAHPELRLAPKPIDFVPLEAKDQPTPLQGETFSA